MSSFLCTIVKQSKTLAVHGCRKAEIGMEYKASHTYTISNSVQPFISHVKFMSLAQQSYIAMSLTVQACFEVYSTDVELFWAVLTMYISSSRYSRVTKLQLRMVEVITLLLSIMFSYNNFPCCDTVGIQCI